MSTYIPSCVFSLDRQSVYTEALYEGKFYDLLNSAYTEKDEFNFRTYSFRGEAHLSSVHSMCAESSIVGLDFIGYELAVITDYQLGDAACAIKALLNLITVSLDRADTDALRPLTQYCYSSSEAIVVEELRDAYANTGDLKDISPYHTGGDEGLNVVHSVFDYMKSLDEIVSDCMDRKRVLVNFHHPA